MQPIGAHMQKAGGVPRAGRMLGDRARRQVEIEIGEAHGGSVFEVAG
jgi:hypothetical protein